MYTQPHAHIHLFCVCASQHLEGVLHTYASLVGVAENNTYTLFLSTLCNQWLTHTHVYKYTLAVSLTSSLNFLYAHINHHGPLGVVGFDQRGQVAAVHLLDVPQVRLAVVWHHFGALLVDVQPTVWQRGTQRRVYIVHVICFQLSEDSAISPQKSEIQRKKKKTRLDSTSFISMWALQRHSSSPTHSNNPTASLFSGTKLNLLTFRNPLYTADESTLKVTKFSLLSHFWVTV